MPRSPVRLTRLLLTVIGSILVAAAAVAQLDLTSQFLVGEGSDRPLRLTNPNRVEMFAVAIDYGSDGTFQDCEGFLMGPRETAWVDDLVSGDGSLEVIAVPTQNGAVGEINRNKFGITGRNGRKHLLQPMLAGRYQLSSDADVRDDVVTCVCGELANENLSPKLFKNFGIGC